MPKLSDAEERVKRILGDTELETAKRLLKDDLEYQDAIENSLRELDRDNPYVVTEDIAGAGEHDYELPSRWVNDYSVIKSVEFPAGSQQPELIEGEDWGIYIPDEDKYTVSNIGSGATSVTCSTVTDALFFKDGNVVQVGNDSANEILRVTTDGVTSTGVIAVEATSAAYSGSSPFIRRLRVLRFLEDAPGVTDVIRLRMTAQHFLVNTAPTGEIDTDSIAADDYEAFTMNVASRAAKMIMVRMAGSEFESYVAHWKTVHEDCLTSYNRHFGKGDVEVRGADGETELDITYQWGSDYVFHPRQWR